MRTSPTHYVRRGQVALGAFLLICVALHPGIVLKRNEAGLSNYGVHAETAVPYSMAFMLAAWYSIVAARLTQSVHRKSETLALVLRCYAVVLISVLLSTYFYKVNNSLNDIHVGVNISAALFETIASIWMFWSFGVRRRYVLWIVVELAGFLLGALTVMNLLHLVFAAEVGMTLGFAILLIHQSQEVEEGTRRYPRRG